MTVRTVHQGGGGDHLTIAAAVAACAAAGDVVEFLDSATYNEAIDLTAYESGGFLRQVDFRAAEGQQPTWDGTSFNLPAIDASAWLSGFVNAVIKVEGIRFTNWNSTFGFGSGVFFSGGRVAFQLTDLVVEDCDGVVINYGWGTSSKPQLIDSCTIRNCGAILFQNGGAGASKITMVNTDVYGAHNGPGFTDASGEATVEHCSLLMRCNISHKALVAFAVHNNVVRNADTYSGWVGIEANAGGTRSHNCVTGSWSVAQQGGTHGGGDVTDDPLFTDESDPDPDLSLQDASPCIDAGTDRGVTEDQEGNPRPRGLAPDMGAWEFQPPPEPYKQRRSKRTDRLVFTFDGLALNEPPKPGEGSGVDVFPELGQPVQRIQELVFILLFTWAQATDENEATGRPKRGRFGWWGAHLEEAGYQLGSLLHQVVRGPVSSANVIRARQLAEEALAPLVEMGAAARVEVRSYRLTNEQKRAYRWTIGLTVSVFAEDGRPLQELRYPELWAEYDEEDR